MIVPAGASLQNTSSEEFAKILKSRVNEIGMLPHVAAQALEMVGDPDCSIHEFAKIVERDVTLAIEVLRMANSSVYGFDTPVNSFDEAVFRLGFRQCKNLIIATCFSTLMKKVTLEEAWVRDLLWQHSYLTGVLAVHVNRTLNLGFAGEEFTAGLLHDFGRLLLALLVPHEFSFIDPLSFVEDDSLILQERNTIGTDHAELGAWYVQENHLPEPLVEAVRWHHEPSKAKHDTLACIVTIADDMANHLQVYEEAEGYNPANNRGIIQLATTQREDHLTLFLDVAATIMERARHDAEAGSKV